MLICFSLSLLRTHGSTVGNGEDQEDFLSELTLHPDSLTPEGLSCTPANAVEVHRDSQFGREIVLLGMHETFADKMLKKLLYFTIPKSSQFY